MTDLAKTLRIMGPFQDWSPNELCHALGYRIDLRQTGNGVVNPFLIGPRQERCVSHKSACRILARLAKLRRIDATNPPKARRALRNGAEQEL